MRFLRTKTVAPGAVIEYLSRGPRKRRMLKVDVNLTHLSSAPDDVITLLESINLPLVSIPNVGTAPTQAYVIGLRNGNGTFTVVVCLRQADNDVNLIYVSEPRELTVEQFRFEEAEGRRFVESMGFLMNDLAVRSLIPETRAKLVQRIAVFARSGASTLDLVEVADDAAPAPVPISMDLPDAIFGAVPRQQEESLRRMQLVQGSPIGGISPEEAITGDHPSFVSARPSAAGRQGYSQGPTSTNPSMRPLTPPQEPPAEPPLSAEALARLGRFLSTFVLLALLPFQCVHTPPGKLSPELQTQVDIAQQQLAQGQWAEAIKTLTPVIEEAPRAHEALHSMGLAYLYLSRPSQAEGYLRRSIEAEPKSSVAKNTLAALLIEQRQCEEAEQLLLQVVEDIFYPTPEFAEHNLARAEHCLGRPVEAIRRLEALVLRRPQFCRGYLTLADMSSEQSQPEMTIRACEHFTVQCERHEELKNFVSPEHSCLCYLKKGLAYAQLGDVEAARLALQSCTSDGAYGRECRRYLQQLNAQ